MPTVAVPGEARRTRCIAASARGVASLLITLSFVTALLGLDARLRMARLFVTTDSRRETDDLEDFLEAAFAGGVDMLSIAERQLKPSRIVAALEVARTVAYHTQGLVVVDESLDVATQFVADVFQLDASTPAASARQILHQWALIGRTATTADEVDAALADPDVNYLTVGPVFPSDGPANLELVRHAAKVARPSDVASKPWFAFGGITPESMEEAFEAGARRLQVSRPAVEPPDTEASCQRFKDRLRRLWHDDPDMEGYVFGVFSLGGM